MKQKQRKALYNSHKLPIRTDIPVYNGKVRSLYWLTQQDSQRLISEQGYCVGKNTTLGIMVMSDRISAFDCIWRAENGLLGVPGKGAALNAISQYWFDLFKKQGLAESHILEVPHPLVWVIQKAKPIKLESIVRQYITGSMWRAYESGVREFCGLALPENLKKNQKLPELLLTPSTKGVISGVFGVPEVDDVNVCAEDILQNFQAFGLKQVQDLKRCEELTRQGFNLISDMLAQSGQIFVDTKFEFGYVQDSNGQEKIIYIDEVGTPDSSRVWDGKHFDDGKVVEKSKETFRQYLLNYFKDKSILLDKGQMSKRLKISETTQLPEECFMAVSKVYTNMAEVITGHPVVISENPQEEIITLLLDRYSVIP